MTATLTDSVFPENRLNPLSREGKTYSERRYSNPACSVAYIGYLGFAAQIPWTVILVHLPILETVLGGSMFSYTLGIAMGLACNVIRFCVVVYGRMFTFRVRVLTGCMFSAFFTLGYYVIYVFSDPLSVIDLENVSAEKTWGFWLGLLLAVFGGAGNAQLMSTGYGVASLMAQERPVANNLFFFGQAMASATCWPLKCLIETVTEISESARLAIVMGLVSAVSISIIPIYHCRISKIPGLHEVPPPEVGWSIVVKVFRETKGPMLVLWFSYFLTNMVTPGQLLQWPLPRSSEDNPKFHRSLCSYVYLLGDAVGKTVPVFLALKRRRIEKILNHPGTWLFMIVIVIVRFCIMLLFYFPPVSFAGQVCMLGVFGFLNGFVASLALSQVSFRVDPALSDVAGYLSSFVIINGLFSGSLVGMLVKVFRHA